MQAPTRVARVPEGCFDTLDGAFELFVDTLGLRVIHRDGELAVVERPGAKACLVANPAFAAGDRSELTLETGSIDALHADIVARRPGLLHPNLPDVTRRPWGAREFALPDRAGVCIVFRQFD